MMNIEKNNFDLANIVRPTLVIRKEQVLQNIRKIAEKAASSQVRFRPHFKTHQSAQIGEWFREVGVNCITVSSVEMAAFFAKEGWRDITIAFPANIREVNQINQLAEQIQLNLLIESMETAQFLQENLSHSVGAFIKIDVGNRRTGISWNDMGQIEKVAASIRDTPKLNLQGILTHAGQTYQVTASGDIKEIYDASVARLKRVRNHLQEQGVEDILISVGDTPSCSAIDDLSEVDEVRPGNFVFYDVMQMRIGSCSEEEIAVAVACPIVAKHAGRGEIIIYGGAIHLSKDYLLRENKTKFYGLIALPHKTGWGSALQDGYVFAVSQEHGIVKVNEQLLHKFRIGDLLMVLPVHSCLTANLLKHHYYII